MEVDILPLGSGELPVVNCLILETGRENCTSVPQRKRGRGNKVSLDFEAGVGKWSNGLFTLHGTRPVLAGGPHVITAYWFKLVHLGTPTHVQPWPWSPHLNVVP